MTTPLSKPVRREIRVGETPLTMTIHRDGVKLIEKGRCKGIDLSWNDTVGGDAALAAALQGSLAA